MKLIAPNLSSLSSKVIVEIGSHVLNITQHTQGISKCHNQGEHAGKCVAQHDAILKAT